MKSIATIVLLLAIQLISSKKFIDNNAAVFNNAQASANSFGLNVGILGNANANSNAFATNVNDIDQWNF
jgi:hypothetical protein